jgi:hypothetical protein
MGGLTFWLVGSVFCAAIVCINWSLLRSRPTDRPAIDVFMEQRGLRVISLARSYNVLHYWFRGIGVGNAVRVYVVAVEDFEGTRGKVHLAFDSLFGHGQIEVLEPQRLALPPPGGCASLKQRDSGTARPNWTWYERLALFGMGVGISGLIFGGVLHGNLSFPNRPVSPEPELGYTYLFTAKYGNVYGTYFEYLVVTYAVWVMWAVGAVSGLFGYILKIQQKSRSYPLQICASAAVSMVIYYVAWRLCMFCARS